MIIQTIVGAVLLFSTPCPDTHALACVQLAPGETPVVYVAPEAGRFALWHELGHVRASQIPGAVVEDEHYANAFAYCNMPQRFWVRWRKAPKHRALCRRWQF